jgi:hypothetical protein
MSSKSTRLNEFNVAFDKMKMDELRWSEIKKREELDGIWEERDDGSKVLKNEVYKRMIDKWKNFYNI